MTARKKYGKIIIPSGTVPERHELKVAEIFSFNGLDIEFIVPSRTPGSRTPDIRMDGHNWEIKAPKGSSSRTIENNFRAAAKQSASIIIDLRRMPIADDKCLVQIKKEFDLRRHVKHLRVIAKGGDILIFDK